MEQSYRFRERNPKQRFQILAIIPIGSSGNHYSAAARICQQQENEIFKTVISSCVRIGIFWYHNRVNLKSELLKYIPLLIKLPQCLRTF